MSPGSVIVTLCARTGCKAYVKPNQPPNWFCSQSKADISGLLSLESAIAKPPTGAGLLIVNVATEGCPPITEVGLSVRLTSVVKR